MKTNDNLQNDPNFFASKALSRARVLRLALVGDDDEANADFVSLVTEIEELIQDAMDCYAPGGE